MSLKTPNLPLVSKEKHETYCLSGLPHPIIQRPHTLRHELSCVSTRQIVSLTPTTACIVTKWCCSKLCPVPCWLRPCSDVVSACVVLFQAQCGVVEGIVLSSQGYCPGLMYVCLFMLQASLSGR